MVLFHIYQYIFVNTNHISTNTNMRFITLQLQVFEYLNCVNNKMNFIKFDKKFNLLVATCI